MALAVQSISLVRENVTSSFSSTNGLALKMPGAQSLSLVLVARAKNDTSPIYDAAAGGGVILEEQTEWIN